MTKACIAPETWSKAEAEEDDRLTDSAALAHTPCPNQSRVRKQLPHSLHPCPMAQLIATTTTALHPHRRGGNKTSRRTKTHETQPTTRSTDRSTQPLLLLLTHSAATSRAQFAETAKGGGRKTKATGQTTRQWREGGQRTDGAETETGGHPPDGRTKEKTLSW